MSCRHNLANGTCTRCFPDNPFGLGEGQLSSPGPEEDYAPNLDAPGAISREAAADTLSDVTCDWHPGHSDDDKPCGQRCGAPATYRIAWLDGSKRFSLACQDHLQLDSGAPEFLIDVLDVPKAG